MRLNNCLFYALWRHLKYGDYIVIRRSRHAHWWPIGRYHYLVIDKDCVQECSCIKSFVPDKDDLGKLPCPLFRGHVKRGDK